MESPTKVPIAKEIRKTRDFLKNVVLSNGMIMNNDIKLTPETAANPKPHTKKNSHCKLLAFLLGM